MTQHSPKGNDNVTLQDVAHYFSGFIRFVYSLLLSAGHLFRQYLLFFILSIIMGGGLGYLLHRKQVTCYTGGITCAYNELHKKIYGEMIVLLNKHIQNHEDSIVGRLLHVNPEVARSMISIEARNIAGSPLHDDVTIEKVPFYVIYKVKNPDDVQEINKGLLYYFLTTKYNTLRREVRLDNARQKIAFINTQLGMLDSLKMSYIKYISRGGSTSSANNTEVNVAELFKESEALFNSKQDAEWILKFDNAVEIVYEQLPTRIESGTDLYKAIIKWAIGSFILFFLFIVCWQTVRNNH